jgi:hypothetical protein
MTLSTWVILLLIVGVMWLALAAVVSIPPEKPSVKWWHGFIALGLLFWLLSTLILKVVRA